MSMTSSELIKNEVLESEAKIDSSTEQSKASITQGTMTKATQQKACRYELVCFLGLTVFVAWMIRMISLGLYPLMDTTEARYGEMARIMYETGDWITPMFDYQVPFWGKPPLFAWLSASGFELFEVNEFAARVPHLLLGIITVALVGWFMARQVRLSAVKSDAFHGWLAAMVLSTTGAFLLLSGAVMTDTALTLAITLSMISFWLAWNTGSKVWGYLFFAGLALGMLAKGPLTLVLVGISLGLWVLADKRLLRVWGALPWVGGTLLFLALSLPWYLLAEAKTPGFLNYFIVGEHFKRFVISGWQGDLYGTAHDEIRGTIWLYWFTSALPWAPILLWQLMRRIKRGADVQELTTVEQNMSEGNSAQSVQHRKQAVTKTAGFTGFLWCWMLSPMLLFTFAGNILPSYVLPGLPAMALLIAEYQRRNPLNNRVFFLGLLMPVLIVAVVWGINAGVSSKEAEKALLNQWSKQPEAQTSQLIYQRKRPFSAQFYSNGKAVQSKEPLMTLVQGLSQPAFIAVEKKRLDVEAVQALSQCEVRAEARSRSLYFCPASSVMQESVVQEEAAQESVIQ